MWCVSTHHTVYQNRLWNPNKLSQQLLCCYLKLLGLEHVGPRGSEDVICQLRLAVDVDRHGGLTGQEVVVDISCFLGQLQERR